MSDLKLIIFDVDGTLVDSQAEIISSMKYAFAGIDQSPPSREDVLGIIGLSLPEAMRVLTQETDKSKINLLVQRYKEAYLQNREENGTKGSPLYPGTIELLTSLHARPDLLLGVATGKSRRGLNALMDAHDLRQYFVTMQMADDHPSKPHPSMIHTALSETGVAAQQTVMIGDTSFDMEMARLAGIHPVGVSWGYHSREALSQAIQILDRWEELYPLLDKIWSARR